MKRISSLLLSLMLLLGLVGCGGETEDLAGAIIDAAISAVEDYDSSQSTSIIGGADGPTDIVVAVPDGSEEEVQTPESSDQSIQTEAYDPNAAVSVVEGEYYYDLESVVLYLDTYGELPDNYITKNEARDLGWEGGTPERFMEGAAIGGDRFGNREGNLPKGNYTECDLNTDGANSRGAERLVFSDNWEYYYTEDHYETFTQVWVEDGEVVW